MNDRLAASADTAAPELDFRNPLPRAAVCHWLASVFLKPPRDAEINAFRRGTAAMWLDLLAGTAELAPGVALIRSAMTSDASDSDLCARLGAAHTKLFTGAGGPLTVAPYESAYTGNGRLYQEPASEMSALLKQHGLHVDKAWAEAPDHISVELSLLAQLLTTGHQDSAVIAMRLGVWVPEFAASCAARDASGYWSGAAAILAAMTRINATATRSDILH